MAFRNGASPLHRLQPAHQPDGLVGHLHEQVGLLLELGQDALDRQEAEQIGYREHVVDDVVELLGQRVDVLPVERRDERRVEALEDLGR